MSVTSRSEPMFTKCCCCIPLRIGCFILGYINLIFHTFYTLTLLSVTTYVGVSTHGFDHFDKEPRLFTDQVPQIESVEGPSLNQIGILLIALLCVNVAWLVINVACLVGLHKKRPGPIRVYVAFATGRLLLALASFVYLATTASADTPTLISHAAALGLALYFILVYYIYAVQLEREQARVLVTPDINVSDVAFIYPSKMDKHILVA